MSGLLHRPAGIEMTHDHPFEARVRRLSVVSSVALGVLVWLAVGDDASPVVVTMLVAGWVLMPAILRASLRRPKLRYGLAAPALLVAVALTVFCLTDIPDDTLAAAGWWTVTASIWFGATLGTWLWFRWLPVPDALDDPFGTLRLVLVAIHVAAALVGIGLVLS